MEDAHTHILTLADDKKASFFAVYDGHGGSKVATHVSRNLHRVILRRPEYKEGRYEEAIIKGYLECDDKMRHEETLKEEMSGSTAITALLRGSDLYVGNVGDSRCIASIRGVADPLSSDHKPGDPLEKARIVSAGGFVELNRVNGNLALSRAVGDFSFKQNTEVSAEDQIVSGCPDVVSRTVSEDWEFILLACDGIWDVLSNQEVADFVIRRIANGLEPEIICEELMTRCLATDNNMGGLGCDNMTVILVCFLHNKPYQHLIDKCAKLLRIHDEPRLKFEAEEDERDEADESSTDEAAPEDTNGSDNDIDDDKVNNVKKSAVIVPPSSNAKSNQEEDALLMTSSETVDDDKL